MGKARAAWQAQAFGRANQCLSRPPLRHAVATFLGTPCPCCIAFVQLPILLAALLCMSTVLERVVDAVVTRQWRFAKLSLARHLLGSGPESWRSCMHTVSPSADHDIHEGSQSLAMFTPQPQKPEQDETA